MGSQLISKKLVADKDYKSITENVIETLKIVKEAKQEII
jgi:2-keto-3-deoxy-6-phosphogluconate aldolase